MSSQAPEQASHAPWQHYVAPPPHEKTKAAPPTHEIVIEQGLRVPMRDGTELAAILWRPKGEGKWPVLVERCPHRLIPRSGDAGVYHAARGMAVLSVGLRGCANSGGDFTGAIPGSPSGDGYDTIEWAAAQAWCNGKVGMICGSISGGTAYQTATEAPPHLIPLFVREGTVAVGAPSAQARQLIGMQLLAMAWTEERLDNYLPEQRARAEQLLADWKAQWQAARQQLEPNSPLLPVPQMARQLPLTPNTLFNGIADYYNELMPAPEQRPHDTSIDLSHYADQVRVPIYHLAAWYDGLIVGNLAMFAALRGRAATVEARAKQRLIIGPWVHGPKFTDGRAVGLLEFGPNAALDFLAFRQRWYDAQINGSEINGAQINGAQINDAQINEADALDHDPAVWLYLVGADQWLGFDEWPPPIAETPWYLDGEQLATTAPGDEQDADEYDEYDEYDYDPNDPVPTLVGGGAMGIGLDQRPVEDRLLTYTSPPLDAPLTLLGPLRCVLYASSSAPDTDWIVRLTMVRPDGASIILSGGTFQARYRHSPLEPLPLEPDVPERFEISMLPVSMVVPAGHALRLTVTSSDFPAFARNLNTGDPNGDESTLQIATNRIYHDADHPSHIVLPVLV